MMDKTTSEIPFDTCISPKPVIGYWLTLSLHVVHTDNHLITSKRLSWPAYFPRFEDWSQKGLSEENRLTSSLSRYVSPD